MAFSVGSLMEAAEGDTQPLELRIVDLEMLTQLFPPRSLRLSSPPSTSSPTTSLPSSARSTPDPLPAKRSASQSASRSWA
jgi:hypothetical protein